ncbi:MAG TPA: competence/damage-inducible protein A [Capsulimonadaceae bacterium]|nr:competence/damage-inducible protein A [Capsulimonadaceae bacterium]
MIAETLSVGTELLLGQIVDTNAAYIAKTLSAIGISLYYRTTVGDNAERIKEAIRLSLARADVLITIGGLGPTMDDLTKEMVCEVIGVELVPDPAIEQRLKDLAATRGYKYPESFLKQALLPKANGGALNNPVGTAPGVLIEKNGKTAICLPGPPNELIPMVEQSVVPYLAEKTGQKTVIKSRVLRIIDRGESMVEEDTKDLLLSENPTVAPLAHLGECHLRITARASSEEEADEMIQEKETALRERLGDYIYGVDDETLEVAVVRLMMIKNQFVATAESCTGGLLAQRITSVPGASDVFWTGIVSYANQTKEKLLKVPKDMLEKHGAVSPEVAAAMAQGARKLDEATIGIGITGIAGPSGGSEEKPVGLVYIGLAAKEGTVVERMQYGGRRDDIRRRASHSALALIRRYLLRPEETLAGGVDRQKTA